jgi:hypothetical protein
MTYCQYLQNGSRDNCGLDALNSIAGRSKRRLFSKASRTAPRPTLSNGYWEFFTGAKRPGREGVNSPPSSAKVKIAGCIHLLSHTS